MWCPPFPIDPVHVMRIRKPSLVRAGSPAVWPGVTIGPPQPNPVASKPTNQQTGDHMLPAPVVRASLSFRLFASLCFDCSLDLWRVLGPLITLRESTDAVIRFMLFYELNPCSSRGLSLKDAGKGLSIICALQRKRGTKKIPLKV